MFCILYTMFDCTKLSYFFEKLNILQKMITNLACLEFKKYCSWSIYCRTRKVNWFDMQPISDTFVSRFWDLLHNQTHNQMAYKVRYETKNSWYNNLANVYASLHIPYKQMYANPWILVSLPVVIGGVLLPGTMPNHQ